LLNQIARKSPKYDNFPTIYSFLKHTIVTLSYKAFFYTLNTVYSQLV